LVIHGLAGPELLEDRDRLGRERDARRRVRIRNRVTPPRGRRRRVLGAHREPQIEPTAREMIDGDRALGEPRRMVGRRVEAVRDGRAETGTTREAGKRAQHRPAVVRPSPQPVAVRDAGVAELVGDLPVASERDDIGSPRLDADRDHVRSIADAPEGVKIDGPRAGR